MPQPLKRFDWSIAAATVAAAFVGAASLAAWSLLVPGERPSGFITLLRLSGGFFVGAHIVIVVVCLPVFLLLRAIGWVRWWSALGFGVFLSLILFPATPGARGMALAWAATGAMSSLAFWAAWRLMGGKQG